jgi:PAS domain-containing protein
MSDALKKKKTAYQTAMDESDLLNPAPEASFDRLTRLASLMTNCQMVQDDTHQFLKSHVGFNEQAAKRVVPLSHSFCNLVVQSGTRIMIDDARTHDILRSNPNIGAAGVVAYAGFPVRTRDGLTLGALCVASETSRKWNEVEASILEDLAALVGTEVDLRREISRATASAKMFSGILNSVEDSLVAVNTDGETLVANAAFKSLLSGVDIKGENRSQWISQIGIFQQDKITPLAPKDFPMIRALSGERVPDLAVFVKNASVPGMWASISAAPVRFGDENSTVQGGVAVIRDITKHRELRERIESSEAKFRAMSQNIPNGVMILLDSNLTVTEVQGRNLVATLGLSAAIGKSLSEIWEPAIVEQLPDFSKVLAGQELNADIVVSSHVFSLHGVPVRDSKQVVISVLLLPYEVTDREQKKPNCRDSHREMN